MILRFPFFIFLIMNPWILNAQDETNDQEIKERNERIIKEFMDRRDKTIASFEGFSPVPFQAPDLNGEDHFLSDFKGQILIIQFWQLYSQESRSQIPSINKLLEDYNDQSVAALGFVDDYGEDLELFVNNTTINYPIIPNSRELGLQAYAGELGYPRVFVIDQYGITRKIIMGAYSDDEMHLYKELKSLIEGLLKE